MICKICGKEFQLTGKQGGQNRVVCFDCLPQCSDRKTRNNLRRRLITQLSDQIKVQRGCCVCGYNRCPAALEWHHPNKDKEGNPSELKSINVFLSEIDKCEVLCANCHRELHANDKEKR